MASNHSSAANDVDLALAVIVHGSNNAAVGTCNNGETSPAVVDSQGMETNSNAQSNVNGVFPFKNFPVKIQNKIIGFAMLATNHEISFPCLTNAAFKPNIAVGLLLVNHRMYHEAHYQLRKQNIFIFNNFGSDLKTVASSVGPLKCRSGECGHGPLRSALAQVTFNLGDEQLPYSAVDKVLSFGNTLRHLRSPIIIDVLYLRLAYHTFKNSAQLSYFASALGMIKVENKLLVTSDEQVLGMGLGELPKKLGMDVLPVYSRFQAYNPEVQYSPGRFLHHYEPEKQASEDADPQQDHLIPNMTDWSCAAKTAIGQLAG